MFNDRLISKVSELRLKHPVTQVSKDLQLSKGMVSSYLGGKLKASDAFLKQFSKFYEIAIEDITDTDDVKVKTPHTSEVLNDEVVVKYVIDNAERLRKSNASFKMFCEWLTFKMIDEANASS